MFRKKRYKVSVLNPNYSAEFNTINYLNAMLFCGHAVEKGALNVYMSDEKGQCIYSFRLDTKSVSAKI